MKKIILCLSLLASLSVQAAEITDDAQVVSYRPLVTVVSDTHQECWNENVQEQVTQSSSPVGAIVGGVAGGILGNQVGQGNGRTAATVGGAILGTIVGNNMSNSQQTQPQYQTKVIQRCRPVNTTREVINGYDVIYRYNGRDGHTTTQYQPGKIIRVGISAQ